MTSAANARCKAGPRRRSDVGMGGNSARTAGRVNLRRTWPIRPGTGVRVADRGGDAAGSSKEVRDVAAVDYFLEIDGIAGESADAKHKGAIVLDSFSFDESNIRPHATGSGAGAGKVEMQDLQLTMKASKASPLLLLACATGQHLKQAVLTVRRAGKAQADFLVLRLSDVLVSTYSLSGHTETAPTEQASLAYARIELEIRAQKADGSSGAAIKAGWDLAANKKV